MKTILIATDYSDPAQNAMDYAAHLAHQTGADLVLFNMFKLSVHTNNSLVSTASIDEKLKKNENRLIELCKETTDRYHINVSWVIGKDDTIESLKTHVNTHHVDLVVMGIESNLIEFKLFGNTTTAAVDLMLFPLLVVPNDVGFEGINTIMYACELSHLKGDHELNVLKTFVRLFKARLEVFHVFANDSERTKSDLEHVMDEKLQDVDHIYRYVNNARIGEGIKAGLEQFPADLLVMIHHKLGFFESIMKGSNTNQMTVRTRVPLLVIPQHQSL